MMNVGARLKFGILKVFKDPQMPREEFSERCNRVTKDLKLERNKFENKSHKCPQYYCELANDDLTDVYTYTVIPMCGIKTENEEDEKNYKLAKKHGLCPIIFPSKDFLREEEFLERFSKKMKKGKITSISEMKPPWEKEIGHPVNEKTFNAMLKRHEWNFEKGIRNQAYLTFEEGEEFLKPYFAIAVEEGIITPTEKIHADLKKKTWMFCQYFYCL